MRNARFGWVIFCALAATLGCAFFYRARHRPSPDWNGTWKMNPSKGNFQGQIFTISISADGEYRYDDGRLSFTFRCDGKDRRTRENRTQACVKSSDTVLDLTRKEKGVKTRVNHWELSGDGNRFYVDGDRFSSDWSCYYRSDRRFASVGLQWFCWPVAGPELPSAACRYDDKSRLSDLAYRLSKRGSIC